MKRLTFVALLWLACTATFAQTLNNPATIGQSTRNQKVGDGLQVTDTLITQGKAFFNGSVTMDAGATITGALSATDSVSTGKLIADYVEAADSVTAPLVAGAHLNGTDSITTPLLVADKVTTDSIGAYATGDLVNKYTLLYSSTTQTGTPASTVETTLDSFPMPANTLAVDGDVIEIRASGAGALSGDIRLYFGSLAIEATGQTVTGKTWEISGIIYRTGLSSQKTIFRYSLSGASFVAIGTTSTFTEIGTLSESHSAIIPIYVTGQNADPNANDLTIETFIVEHKKQ